MKNESMNKFKVGDRVKVTKAYGYAIEGGLKAGDVTEIIGDRLEMNGYGRPAYYLKSPEQCRYDISKFKSPDGRWGVFLPDEIELVKDEKPKQKKQKHIFIRVDKEIEPGDLVRCVEHDWPFKSGDIRKVRTLSGTVDGIFFIHGSFIYLDKPRWEVVHKLKVGDLVELHENGKPMKVTAVYPEDNRFSTPGMMLDWYATDEFRLYQKPKTEWDINTLPVEPVTYGLNKVESADDSPCSLCIPRLEPSHTIAMQKAVAEMVVELMDKKTEVKLGAYSNIGMTTVDDHFPRRNLGCAALAGNDTWDTLTGLYVALCKATGRKLPDWVYGKEAEK